jgi:hypothetical protein
MSSQQQLSLSFSSAQRNRAKWPTPSVYEVKLPMAVQRVRQVVLGAIDLPQTQRTVEEGDQAFFPVYEGLKLHATPTALASCFDSCASQAVEPGSHCGSSEEDPCCNNVLQVCEEGGGKATLALPLHANSVTLVAHDGCGKRNYRLTTECPHGLHRNECIGAELCVGDQTYAVQKPLMVSCLEVDVYIDTEDEIAGEDACLVVPALGMCDITCTLEAQLAVDAPCSTLTNRYCVEYNARGELQFRTSQGMPFQVGVGSVLQEMLGFRVQVIYSCPNENGEQRAHAQRCLPHMLFCVEPGQYDAQTMGNAMARAANCFFLQTPQTLWVRLHGTATAATVPPGFYTPAWLAEALQGALRVATGDDSWTVRFCQSRFRISYTEAFILCANMGAPANAELLRALGLYPIEYGGRRCYQGSPVHVPWPYQRQKAVYKLSSGLSKAVANAYSVHAYSMFHGGASCTINPCLITIPEPPATAAEGAALLAKAMKDMLAEAENPLAIDCVIVVHLPLSTGLGALLLVSNWCTTLEVGDVVSVGVGESTFLAQVLDGGGFWAEVEGCTEAMTEAMVAALSSEEGVLCSPVTVWHLGHTAFDLPLAGCERYTLVERLGFRYENMCGCAMYESVQSWHLGPPPFILMQLGTPKSGAPWKFYTTVEGQIVPYFAVLGTSTQFSRVYQDTADYKTSGTKTVGTVRVEFLNPDLTPYQFHGKDHLITLVFVTEGDQALLSCS